MKIDVICKNTRNAYKYRNTKNIQNKVQNLRLQKHLNLHKNQWLLHTNNIWTLRDKPSISD